MGAHAAAPHQENAHAVELVDLCILLFSVQLLQGIAFRFAKLYLFEDFEMECEASHLRENVICRNYPYANFSCICFW